MVKDLPAKAGHTRDWGSNTVSGRFPSVGNGNLLQYSCLENSMVREDWQAIIHGVAESDMNEQLSINVQRDMSS